MSLRIVYEGDEAAARSHLPQAQNLLYKVRDFVAASGAGVYSSRVVIDDRTYAYALKIGDMEALHIFSLPESPPPLEAPEFNELPDFLNGVIRGGWLRTEMVPVPGRPPRELKLLGHFKPNNLTAKRLKMNSSFVESARLAIVPDKRVFPNISAPVPAPPDRTASQYVSVRPSNYSGRMQALVQVCLGFGRLPPHRVYETEPGRRTAIITEGLQMIYDYRNTRTHGISVGKDGALWLVEISIQFGVRIMQLPVIPNTSQLNAVDPDLAAVIETFKGVPTGGGFPTGRRLAQLTEAGLVLQLIPPADMDVFYREQPYYSSCGWAFNMEGNEAHNTCWGYGINGDGLKRGYHFAVRITIGEIKAERERGEPIVTASARLVKVAEGLLYYPNTRPITGAYPQGVPPPPIKFFEPLVDALFNFSLRPQSGLSDYPEYANKKMCDTTMHVYFGGGQLKQIKYYYDRTRKNVTGVTGNRDPNTEAFTSWTTVDREGTKYVPAMVYTTDVDNRRELVPNTTITTSTASYMGVAVQGVENYQPAPASDGAWANEIGGQYMSGGAMEDEGGAPYQNGWFAYNGAGRYIQTHVWQQHIQRDVQVTPDCGTGIAIPDGLREGYIYVYFERIGSSSARENWNFLDLHSHYTYLAWNISRSPGSSEFVVADEGTFRSFNGKTPYPNVPTFYDPTDQVHVSGWASKGQTVTRKESGFGNGYQREVFKPARGSFTATLFTARESGGLPLHSISNYDAALAEWSKWYNSTADLPQPVQMGVYHSADLGEYHIVYDTQLVSLPQHRRYTGSLVRDQAGSALTKFNFIGVP